MANTKLKRAARARQKRTGERYTEALARVREEVGMPTLKTDELSLSDAIMIVDHGWSLIQEHAQVWKETVFPPEPEPPEPLPYPVVASHFPLAAQQVQLEWTGIVKARTWFRDVPAVTLGENIIKPLSPELKFQLRAEEVLGEEDGKRFNGILQTVGRLGLLDQGKSPLDHHPRVEWLNFRVYAGAPHSSRFFTVTDTRSPRWSGRQYTKEKLQPLWDNRKQLFEDDFYAYQAKWAQQREQLEEEFFGPQPEKPASGMPDYALDEDGSPSYL